MTVKRRSSFRRTCNRRLILNFPCAVKLIRNLTFNARFSSARYIDRPMSLLFVVHAFGVCLFFKENSRRSSGEISGYIPVPVKRGEDDSVALN